MSASTCCLLREGQLQNRSLNLVFRRKYEKNINKTDGFGKEKVGENMAIIKGEGRGKSEEAKIGAQARVRTRDRALRRQKLSPLG